MSSTAWKQVSNAPNVNLESFRFITTYKSMGYRGVVEGIRQCQVPSGTSSDQACKVERWGSWPWSGWPWRRGSPEQWTSSSWSPPWTNQFHIKGSFLIQLSFFPLPNILGCHWTIILVVGYKSVDFAKRWLYNVTDFNWFARLFDGFRHQKAPFFQYFNSLTCILWRSTFYEFDNLVHYDFGHVQIL